MNPYGSPPQGTPPPGYGPSGYQPSGYQPPTGPPSDDTMAWVGIVCSTLSWLGCCCMIVPLVGIIASLGSLVLAVIGCVCGGLAYRDGKRMGTRTDLALIGLILGAARLVLTFGLIGVALALGMGAVLLEGFQHAH